MPGHTQPMPGHTQPGARCAARPVAPCWACACMPPVGWGGPGRRARSRESLRPRQGCRGTALGKAGLGSPCTPLVPLVLRPQPCQGRRDLRLPPLGCGFFGWQLLPHGVSTSCLMLIIAAMRICSHCCASPVCLVQFRGTVKASEQIHGISRQRGLIPSTMAGPDWVVTAA